MAQKPALPKGTRDLLPRQMAQREYILQALKTAFKKYGFAPIETPAMEKVETLTGKYGEEGDRLIFRILPRGRKLDKAMQSGGDKMVFEQQIEEALRYDLTVPFARFVVQHQNEISFPFKRYQIQPVWRADRPQKGRFREFYQCDADAVGSKSLWQEVDFIALYSEVFQTLGLPFKIKMNNRKVLSALSSHFGIEKAFTDFTVALDKLDKIGLDGVLKELSEKGLPSGAKDAIKTIVELKGTNEEVLESLSELLPSDQHDGLKELKFVLSEASKLNLDHFVDLDFSLARGLDYYTGAIFEVKAEGIELGSIGGGGRYDDLTGIFGLANLPGVGISFGLDRIQLALQELELLPVDQADRTQIMFLNLGEAEASYSRFLVHELRALGISCELYPDATKMRKQLDYADKQGIPFVVIIGSKEMNEGRYTLKNMRSGEQDQLGKIELLERFNPQQEGRHGAH